MERPSIRAVRDKEDAGIYYLNVTPVDATRDLRKHLDALRPSGALNFVPSGLGDVSVRLGFGTTIESVIGNFADIVEIPQEIRSEKSQIIDTTPL